MLVLTIHLQRGKFEKVVQPLFDAEIRNPKHEIRNKFEYQNSKAE